MFSIEALSGPIGVTILAGDRTKSRNSWASTHANAGSTVHPDKMANACFHAMVPHDARVAGLRTGQFGTLLWSEKGSMGWYSVANVRWIVLVEENSLQMG